MSFFAISALTNALTSIILGCLVYLAGPKEKVNRTFFIATFAVFVWSIGYFLWQISSDQESALQWLRILMLGSIFISPTYFHFALTLINKERAYLKYIVIAYLQAIIFALFDWSPLYISGVRQKLGFEFWPDPGPLYHFFLPISWVFIVASALMIFRSMRSSTGEESGRLKYIFIATLIGYIGGYTNYFLWYDIPIPPFGNIGTSIYIALVAYAIMRHRLFNMKVIATELLVFALWLFTFVRLLLSSSLNEQLIDGGFLAVSLLAGTLLIRSVDKEVDQRERIEKLSQEKSEFMTFASHEIRNPITAMRGYASLILDGTTGEVGQKTKEVAQTILIQGNDVLNLIAQYLSKSKMELGQISYAKAPFDMGHVVSSIAEGYRPHAEQKGLSLATNLDPSQKYMVVGDEGKVKEVIGNIVDNSLKYTKQGGITISVERHGVAIRTVVSDTGVGIPPATLPQLFKKFSRADAQKVNLLGTGIGLYLAKTFIEAQGAHIWAESDGKDKGSRFIIEFPATESSSSAAV